MSADFDAIVIGSGFGGAVDGGAARAGQLQGARARARTALAAEGLSARSRRSLGVGPGLSGTLQRLVRPPHLAQHVGGTGRRRRRRLSGLRQHLDRRQGRQLRPRAGRRRSRRRSWRPTTSASARCSASRRSRTAQWPERTRLIEKAARRKGGADRFEPLDLAVTFDPQWRYSLDDPHDVAHSKKHTNAHGVEQGTCVHLGNCDIGCDVQAKNTLDLNYLPVAERNGAEIRPLHLVRHVAPEPSGPGYRVAFDRIVGGALIAGSATAQDRRSRLRAPSDRPSCCCGRATWPRRCRI